MDLTIFVTNYQIFYNKFTMISRLCVWENIHYRFFYIWRIYLSVNDKKYLKIKIKRLPQSDDMFLRLHLYSHSPKEFWKNIFSFWIFNANMNTFWLNKNNYIYISFEIYANTLIHVSKKTIKHHYIIPIVYHKLKLSRAMFQK